MNGLIKGKRGMRFREFDLDDIIDLKLRNRMKKARAHTTLRSRKQLNFYITSHLFPSISLTGSKCSLNCKHCSGILLERLIPCDSPESLISMAQKLIGHGAKGLLITGGCDRKGKVPVPAVADAIRIIKNTTDLIVIAHTGFINKEEAQILKQSGLDGVGFDVVGDMETVRRVYGLTVSEDYYISSLKALSNAGLMLFPHICVGLDGGKLCGELHALSMIKGYQVSTVVITGLMPLRGTPFYGIKPDPVDFARVITAAVEMFPETPITLGCARSSGQSRELIDYLAIESGVQNIAIPTRYAIEYAKYHGYRIQSYGTCCGVPPLKNTCIHEPLYGGRI
jgi:uncharacterized radical SAM superfamily protein